MTFGCVCVVVHARAADSQMLPQQRRVGPVVHDAEAMREGDPDGRVEQSHRQLETHLSTERREVGNKCGGREGLKVMHQHTAATPPLYDRYPCVPRPLHARYTSPDRLTTVTHPLHGARLRLLVEGDVGVDAIPLGEK